LEQSFTSWVVPVAQHRVCLMLSLRLFKTSVYTDHQELRIEGGSHGSSLSLLFLDEKGDDVSHTL
jgi:hypothetical protein